jgi:hypothetical protein
LPSLENKPASCLGQPPENGQPQLLAIQSDAFLSVYFQQDELEYWKSRAARLTLLVEQINTLPCKMTVVTLKTAQCKLVKVSDTLTITRVILILK